MSVYIAEIEALKQKRVGSAQWTNAIWRIIEMARSEGSHPPADIEAVLSSAQGIAARMGMKVTPDPEKIARFVGSHPLVGEGDLGGASDPSGLREDPMPIGLRQWRRAGHEVVITLTGEADDKTLHSAVHAFTRALKTAQLPPKNPSQGEPTDG